MKTKFSLTGLRIMQKRILKYFGLNFQMNLLLKKESTPWSMKSWLQVWAR